MFLVWIIVPELFSLFSFLHVALLDTATSSHFFFPFQKSNVTVYCRVCEFFVDIFSLAGLCLSGYFSRFLNHSNKHI